MLLAMLRQCSGNAQALPQAMLKHAHLLAAYGWYARPMASMSRCAAAAAEVGSVTDQSLIEKSVVSLRSAGREDCRIGQQNDLETLILILSHHAVSSH